MRLRLPPQFTIEMRTSQKDLIQQLDAPAIEVEGNLARYETRGVKGWLFQPVTGDEVLFVPSKAKLAPETFQKVIAFDLAESRPYIDASSGAWLRTPLFTVRGLAVDLILQL